jgi:hypothetical protein
MRKTSSRSVRLPEGCPPEVIVTATEAAVARSGTKRYHCSPLQIDLPTIRVDLGRVHVRLPTMRLHAELLLPANSGGTAVPEDTEGIASRLAGSGWRVEESSTEAEVTIEPPRVTVTPTRVHAVPESPSRRCFWVETRWNDTRVTTTTSAIAGRISGCVHEE